MREQEAAMQTATDDKMETTIDFGTTAVAGTAAVGPTEWLMMREMTHRINNELTSMIGVVSLVAARSSNPDVQLALEQVIEHLYDQARIYRALQMPAGNGWIDATAYMRDLCESISRAKLQSNGVELMLVEHPIRLSTFQCWKLGMIISELITNSCRHAFGDKGGSIRVELIKQGSCAVCRVTDDGTSSEIVRTGHGLKIVQQLALALDGEIDLRLGRDGAIATISFPIAERAQNHWPRVAEPSSTDIKVSYSRPAKNQSEPR
jgi:two-component sensor histidine kinase